MLWLTPIDYMFREVISNKTVLLYSLRDNSPRGEGRDVADPNGKGPAPVYYETAYGGRGVWAKEQQVNQHGVQNLDALEIFGPEGRDDAYRFSLYDDATTGCSVWAYDDTAHTSTCDVAQGDVAAAIARFLDLDLASIGSLVDIDALMQWSDTLMFSLWPIAGTGIIGDGVYVWNRATGDIDFLFHGKHAWSEGWLGVNVDALEAAVPEPASLGLMAAGLLGLGWARRRTT